MVFSYDIAMRFGNGGETESSLVRLAPCVDSTRLDLSSGDSLGAVCCVDNRHKKAGFLAVYLKDPLIGRYGRLGVK